jgi:hypothetical protein
MTSQSFSSMLSKRDDASVASTTTADDEIDLMSVKASKVQFKLDGVVVHPIPNKSDLSPDETCNIWYTKDDYRDMKDDNELLLTALKVNHKAIRIYCYRGLEYKLESFGRRRQSNIMRA